MDYNVAQILDNTQIPEWAWNDCENSWAFVNPGLAGMLDQVIAEGAALGTGFASHWRKSSANWFSIRKSKTPLLPGYRIFTFPTAQEMAQATDILIHVMIAYFEDREDDYANWISSCADKAQYEVGRDAVRVGLLAPWRR